MKDKKETKSVDDGLYVLRSTRIKRVVYLSAFGARQASILDGMTISMSAMY